MAILYARKGSAAGKQFLVSESAHPTIIGRDPNVAVSITDERASRRHAAVRVEHGRWIVEDLGASNGTWLDGAKIDRAELRQGSVIRIGGSELVFDAHGLLPIPIGEIHGALLERVLDEESGILRTTALQRALDRTVRLDLPIGDGELPGSVPERLREAMAAAQGFNVPGLLVPILVEPQGPPRPFVLLRSHGDSESALATHWVEILAEPIERRFELLRALVQATLARAERDALCFPISLYTFSHTVGPRGARSIALPTIDLAGAVSEARGDTVELARYLVTIAPERQRAADSARRPPESRATQVYSIGAIGYQLLTGRLHRDFAATPFGADYRPPAARDLEPAIPPAVSDLLNAMLADVPASRPDSTRDIVGALAAAPLATTAGRPPPRRAAAASPSVSAADGSPRAGSGSSEVARPRVEPLARSEKPGIAADGAPLRRRIPVPVSGRLVFLPLWIALWAGAFFAARAFVIEYIQWRARN
jgi:pSer/pThr/pTyr-binding forkhead associated (FHA) protein